MVNTDMYQTEEMNFEFLVAVIMRKHKHLQ
jgi:hypothetical protein